MSFHEVRFPTGLSFGSLGGPERRTEIVTLANGFEERNTPWAHSRRRYDAGMGLRSLSDVAALVAFFEARRGSLHGFRWKDWSDFKSCGPEGGIGHEDQRVGTGDGANRTFQLVKLYGFGDAAYGRPIHKPIAGTVTIGIDGRSLAEGTDFAVDPARGVVTLAAAPAQGAAVTAGFEFDVPVRFDTDIIQTSVATFGAGEVPSVPVVEVRI